MHKHKCEVLPLVGQRPTCTYVCCVELARPQGRRRRGWAGRRERVFRRQEDRQASWMPTSTSPRAWTLVKPCPVLKILFQDEIALCVV
jgi:hypothetical protein